MTKGSNNNYKSAGPKNQFFIHFLLVRRIFAMHFARETFFLENVRDIREQRLMLIQSKHSLKQIIFYRFFYWRKLIVL